MVRYDVTYTNGVIASREKYLLGEKVLRLTEISAEEAFRVLLEHGFGGGAETASSMYDFERLIAVEEERLDSFIREYAPSKAEASYLLSPRDFHNAKALVKATYLGKNAEKMLAPAGLFDIETLSLCVKEGKFTTLKENEKLMTACEEAVALLQEEASGAKVGAIFEKALYEHLKETVKRKPVLRKLLAAKADMTNILTAVRAENAEEAGEKYLPAGTIEEKILKMLFADDKEKTLKAFQATEYKAFVAECLAAQEKQLPLTNVERIRDSFDIRYFEQRKYELSKTEPFLYYVYRRKAENTNVRIVFVCLLAGLQEQDIKRRLRIV